MSMTITSAAPGTAQPAAIQAKAAPQVRQPGTEAPSRAQRPAKDEYVPAEAQEPSGLYWVGRDEDGAPKVYFDDPERAADHAEQPEQNPDAPGGKKAETCTGNTDKVDREIERLKKQKETLEQQISAQTDSGRIKELERKLAQVERELAQKDNDTYRRRHTVFS